MRSEITIEHSSVAVPAWSAARLPWEVEWRLPTQDAGAGGGGGAERIVDELSEPAWWSLGRRPRRRGGHCLVTPVWVVTSG